MNEKKEIKFYNEYVIRLNRFCSINNLYLFTFSLDVLEKCTLIFEGELELESPQQLTEQFFQLNYFQFKRISLQLKFPFKYELLLELFTIYCYARTILNKASNACKLHKPGAFMVGEAMQESEIEAFRREQKYKTRQRQEVLKNKGKFEHYFYEFYFYKINVTGSLKLYDSIRKNLLENGDTIELINNRDVITSILKHFEYMSKGLKIEKSKNISNHK